MEPTIQISLMLWHFFRLDYCTGAALVPGSPPRSRALGPQPPSTPPQTATLSPSSSSDFRRPPAPGASAPSPERSPELALLGVPTQGPTGPPPPPSRLSSLRSLQGSPDAALIPDTLPLEAPVSTAPAGLPRRMSSLRSFQPPANPPLDPPPGLSPLQQPPIQPVHSRTSVPRAASPFLTPPVSRHPPAANTMAPAAAAGPSQPLRPLHSHHSHADSRPPGPHSRPDLAQSAPRPPRRSPGLPGLASTVPDKPQQGAPTDSSSSAHQAPAMLAKPPGLPPLHTRRSGAPDFPSKAWSEPAQSSTPLGPCLPHRSSALPLSDAACLSLQQEALGPAPHLQPRGSLSRKISGLPFPAASGSEQHAGPGRMGSLRSHESGLSGLASFQHGALADLPELPTDVSSMPSVPCHSPGVSDPAVDLGSPGLDVSSEPVLRPVGSLSGRAAGVSAAAGIHGAQQASPLPGLPGAAPTAMPRSRHAAELVSSPAQAGGSSLQQRASGLGLLQPSVAGPEPGESPWQSLQPGSPASAQASWQHSSPFSSHDPKPSSVRQWQQAAAPSSESTISSCVASFSSLDPNPAAQPQPLSFCFASAPKAVREAVAGPAAEPAAPSSVPGAELMLSFDLPDSTVTWGPWGSPEMESAFAQVLLEALHMLR